MISKDCEVSDQAALKLDASHVSPFLSRAARRFKLTRREIEVVALLILGETWKSVADCLKISISMVRTHSKNLHRKIGAKNQASAAAKILRPDTYSNRQMLK